MTRAAGPLLSQRLAPQSIDYCSATAAAGRAAARRYLLASSGGPAIFADSRPIRPTNPPESFACPRHLPRPAAVRSSQRAARTLLAPARGGVAGGARRTRPQPSTPAPAVESVPFRAGTDGYFAFRIPALVTSTQGTLLAFCEGRKTSLSDDGDNDLVLRRSFDAGRTWEPLQLVHEEGGDAVVTIGNPCAVVDRTTGVVWLTMNRENGRVLVTSSSDDGQTWAAPRDITTDVSRPEWGWYAMGPGCGIQLTASGSNHSHPGRLVIPANHRTTPDRSGPSSSHVIYSDDHGRSWHVGGTVGPHTNECQLAELGDGRLLINCRNHRGKAPGNPEGKTRTRRPPHHGREQRRRAHLERARVGRRPHRAHLPSRPDPPRQAFGRRPCSARLHEPRLRRRPAPT